MQHRVAVLCGSSLLHRNTCATLIEAGLNVVAICVCDRRTAGLPVGYVLRRVRQKGFRYVVSQAAARLLYKALNDRKDARALREIVDRPRVDATLQKWGGVWLTTHDFGEPATVHQLAHVQPDVFVVHSGEIIPADVLRLPRTGLTIGGHPGLTPSYRGSHSAFWAISRGRPEDVGCTVFLLDDGIDTGAILAQERVSIGLSDSFMTLGWRGMIRQAEIQATIVRDLDEGIAPRATRVAAPKGSYFDNPRLSDYLRYRRLRICR